uniref:G-protein coupled receptors family 1 profile domain-containing protein n=1 Tax=Scleropages formosus TaxID=113540 RepID=A0A8C9VB27_SCLFO
MTTQSRTYNNAHFCYESSNKSCAKHDYSATVRAPLYVVLGAVIILTVFGNLLVIITIAHFKQLHTPTNYLVLSLAVTDFLLGAVIMPPSMVRSLETCWYLGKLFCKIHTSADITLCNTSILNLSLISVDRYYAVCQPLRYHSKITNYVTMTMILTCWSLSALLGFGMIFSDLNTWATAEIYTENFLCEGSCTVLQSRILPSPRTPPPVPLGKPQGVPGQPGDVVSPTCPGSAPRPFPSGTCPEHLTREASRRHPEPMPEPPQLAPLDAEEQRFYSELLPGD